MARLAFTGRGAKAPRSAKQSLQAQGELVPVDHWEVDHWEVDHWGTNLIPLVTVLGHGP